MSGRIHRLPKQSEQANRFDRLLSRYGRISGFTKGVVGIVGATVILLALVEVAAFLFLSIPAALGAVVTDRRLGSEVYQGEPWAERYFVELAESFEAEYYPYVGYRRKPGYNGLYITINSESLRKTVPQCPDPSAESLRVFVLGGSTIWGTGARDAATIPSHLARRLCAQNVPVEVTNFGESGYTSTEELIRLELALRENNIPDIVIFYDGVNDTFSAYQSGIAGWPQNVRNRQIEFNMRNRANLRPLLKNVERIIQAWLIVPLVVGRKSAADLNAEIAQIYLGNLALVKALADGYGFRVFFYWQPVLYTKDVLSPDEQQQIDQDETIDQVYNAITADIRESGGVRDLSKVFDKIDGTVFIDWAHVSEEGNAIVADAIADDIVRELAPP